MNMSKVYTHMHPRPAQLVEQWNEKRKPLHMLWTSPFPISHNDGKHTKYISVCRANVPKRKKHMDVEVQSCFLFLKTWLSLFKREHTGSTIHVQYSTTTSVKTTVLLYYISRQHQFYLLFPIFLFHRNFDQVHINLTITTRISTGKVYIKHK